MIYYKTNDSWLGDIAHLTKSWTMVKIMRAVAIIGVVSLVVCMVHMEVDWWTMKVDPSIFSFLGVVLSILLVFRTNTAYDRWWEGRKQWGALVNNCRNLAILVNSSFPENDEDGRHKMASRISNFCIALKEHLRDGTKLDEFVFVSEAELEVYKTKGHIPNHITNEIYDQIKEEHRQGRITEGDLINLGVVWKSLLDILGACERIKKTPIPFSYNVFLKIFITVYGAMLPLGLVETFGYFTIPLTMLVFFAFIGVEMMAEEIEDPFGLDCNDLPTGDIAHTIKNNVFEILTDRSSVGKTPERELYTKVF